jgi:toxin-antitoxin system PIN domain toxin
MILVDVNLLVFASNPDSPFHSKATSWWVSELRAQTPIAIAWITVSAFVRLTTNRSVMKKPLSSIDSVAQMTSWLSRSHIKPAEPGSNYWRIFSDLIVRHSLSGSSITDAHLCALAIENGWELCAADNGFSRFKGLQWKNPITS